MDDDLDDRILPNGLKGFIVVIAVVMLLASPFVLTKKNPQKPDISGCYSTDAGPDIFIDNFTLTVLQEPPLTRRYSIKMSKRWAIEIEPGFDWVWAPDGTINVTSGFPHGEFLFLKEQFGPMPKPPTFWLSSESLMQKTRYVRTGQTCKGTTAKLQY